MKRVEQKTGFQARQQGFGMLEVLVAVVILSVGIIGAVSLSTSAIRQSSNANQQAMAATLAQQTIERMRANQNGVVDGDYDFEDVAVDCTAPPAKSCEFDGTDANNSTTRCDTAEMAAFDAYAIACSTEFLALPNAALNITCLQDPCDEPAMHRVTVQWTIPPGAAEDQKSVTVTFFPGGGS
jgi:type IV pilus assembly protein PilV